LGILSDRVKFHGNRERTFKKTSRCYLQSGIVQVKTAVVVQT
jgi:hypothetical protein